MSDGSGNDVAAQGESDSVAGIRLQLIALTITSPGSNTSVRDMSVCSIVESRTGESDASMPDA